MRNGWTHRLPVSWTINILQPAYRGRRHVPNSWSFLAVRKVTATACGAHDFQLLGRRLKTWNSMWLCIVHEHYVYIHNYIIISFYSTSTFLIHDYVAIYLDDLKGPPYWKAGDKELIVRIQLGQLASIGAPWIQTDTPENDLLPHLVHVCAIQENDRSQMQLDSFRSDLFQPHVWRENFTRIHLHTTIHMFVGILDNGHFWPIKTGCLTGCASFNSTCQPY